MLGWKNGIKISFQRQDVRIWDDLFNGHLALVDNAAPAFPIYTNPFSSGKKFWKLKQKIIALFLLSLPMLCRTPCCQCIFLLFLLDQHPWNMITALMMSITSFASPLSAMLKIRSKTSWLYALMTFTSSLCFQSDLRNYGMSFLFSIPFFLLTTIPDSFHCLTCWYYICSLRWFVHLIMQRIRLVASFSHYSSVLSLAGKNIVVPLAQGTCKLEGLHFFSLNEML